MKKLISTLLFLLILSGKSIFAQAGTLDQSFGNGGKVITKLSATDFGEISSIALQQDGKIVATGYSFNAVTSKYYLKTLRYKTSGVLDSSFGNNGIVTTAISLVDEDATSIVVQANGKILVTGYAMLASYDFVIIRYKPNGNLDSSFGLNGIVIKDLGDDEYANTMALQADGKILIAGSASNGNNQDFTVLRYDTNGTIDNTFGSSGKVMIPMATGTEDIPISMLVQPDGKIVLGGFSFNTTTFINKISIARISATGVLDNTFGSSGKILSSLNAAGDMVFSIALQSDGKILATGSSDRTTSDILLLRYTASGLPDNTFGTSGVVYTGFGNKADQGISVAVQANGKIWVSGTTDSNATDFALLRYNANGTLDNGFGNGGKVVTNISGDDNLNTMRVQADGKIILGGGNGTDLIMARYNGDPAMIDGGLSNLNVPSNKCGAIGSAQTVTIMITNNGNNIINSGAAAVSLQITGANTGTYNLTNPSSINSGGNLILSFNSVNLPAIGNNIFTATLMLAADTITANNTITGYDTSFNLKPVVSFTKTNIANTYNFMSGVTGRNPITYQWDFGDASPQSILPNPSHHYSFVGNYAVKLIATDACGKDSSIQTINITTGINKRNSIPAFTVFPNPANNEIRVSHAADAIIRVTDIAGKIIFELSSPSEETLINTSQWAEGIYILELGNNAIKIFVRH